MSRERPLAEAVDLQQALDEVFATPPEGFVAARDALVKRLRAEKRRDDVAAVGSLRRPNRLVWALDQLALDDDPTLPPLLEAVEAVRDASGGDLREAVAELRTAVGAAAGAAAGRLDPSRAGDRADLGAALHAVVADAEALEALEAGRLLEVPEANAFGMAAAPAPRAEAPPARKKAKAKAKAEPAPDVDPLARRRAEKAHREAAEALADAEAAVEAAEAEVNDAADERADAQQEVTEAEARLEAARARLDEASEAEARAVDTRAAAEATRAHLAAAEEAARADLD